MKKHSENIQRFGRSLLLPIALMAPVGMIMGITGAFAQSYMIEKIPFLGNDIFQMIIQSLRQISSVIFDNIPILFAMGVAYGMANNEKGLAVFGSVVSYFTLNMVMHVYLVNSGKLADPDIMGQVGQGMVLGIQTLKIEVLGGIISGLLGAYVTDKYYRLELPLAFAFFGGKKSVPIISFALTIPIGLIVPLFWSLLTKLLIAISPLFMNDNIGVGVYWALNRTLIPFGLHHVLSSMVRFTEAGGVYVIGGEQYIGILNAVNHILFQLGPESAEWSQFMPKLTGYLASGQMLTTLFRFPAIGLAMYHTAFEGNKKITKGLVLTFVLTAFLGNITEPLEFSFLFIAPQLFAVYVLLVAITTIPLAFLDVSIGYIRGTIFDFAIFGLLYDNTHWIQLVLLGLVNFVVFYVVFRYLIIYWDLETPGREPFELEASSSELLKDRNYPKMAKIALEGLGGPRNIIKVENCISRLRVDLNDKDLVDIDKIRESGCSGIFFPSEDHIHVVFGPHVEFVRNEIDDLLK